jgi:hypothetical protein
MRNAAARHARTLCALAFVSCELFSIAAWLNRHEFVSAGLAFGGLIFAVGFAVADYYVVSK